MARIAIGLAWEKYGRDLVKEQEITANIADMVIQVFAMESGLLRAIKHTGNMSDKKAQWHVMVISVYIAEYFPQIIQMARQIVAAIFEDLEIGNHRFCPRYCGRSPRRENCSD